VQDESEKITADTPPLEIWPSEHDLQVTHTPTIGKLVAALAKAQLNYKAVLKQNENVAFMRGGKASKYADLATYIDATQEALAKEELVVMQWPDVSPEAKNMSLVSILAHSSGEWIKGTLTLPALGRQGFDAQSCGSSITYARRYSYAAITGCASEDDDGNAASGRGSREAAQEVAREKNEAARARQAQQGASDTPPQLCMIPVGEDSYDVQGDSEVMNAHKEALLMFGKRVGKAVRMTGENLDKFKRVFVEERGGILVPLKPA
jgi:hypothetical protein